MVQPRLKEALAKEFELKDLGELRYFLGMESARIERGIFVSQRKYILDLLEETWLMYCKPADTPIEPNLNLVAQVNTEQYQRLKGNLIYLAHTRPDISLAVSLVSQFMHSPSREHLEAVVRILRLPKVSTGKGAVIC